MTMFEALDKLVDAIYENLDLDIAHHRPLRKPLADAIRALRKVEFARQEKVIPPAATNMRNVMARLETGAVGRWRILLSCGHSFEMRRDSRRAMPHVGSLMKCWTCNEAQSANARRTS